MASDLLFFFKKTTTEEHIKYKTFSQLYLITVHSRSCFDNQISKCFEKKKENTGVNTEQHHVRPAFHMWGVCWGQTGRLTARESNWFHMRAAGSTPASGAATASSESKKGTHVNSAAGVMHKANKWILSFKDSLKFDALALFLIDFLVQSWIPIVDM